MALIPGTRLGPYEVSDQIGVGGMGEVYRATDTNLGREVAIKVLPDAVSQDEDRLARFEREARTLASLNHPNIAQIYGLEKGPPEAGPHVRALVMELVEGPTLADILTQGAMPVDEALAVAKQIAEALEAAHERGIIHRDLKPANVKVRTDGTVKVLDFGLAKAMDTSPGSGSSISLSPTITTPAMTQAGLILGTAAYMSPEQAKGKPVDKRADIWAFGAVLFEMLTGQRAFAGDEVSDVLASVLAREPQLAGVPASVPGRVRQVLKACLQKDPKHRVHDMADVRLAMAGAFETATPTPAPARARLSRMIVPAAAIVIVAAGIAAAAAWSLKPAEPRPVKRFSHQLGEEAFTRTGRHIVAVSRDGKRLAYVADTQIYLRNLDDSHARPIPGTNENPSSPFFSPDGEWVGYWSTSGQIKKIPVAGGTPVTLTMAANPIGVSWGQDDTILYAEADGIWRVSANGGLPTQVVKSAAGERVHAPQMLPGGDAVLFTVTKDAGASGWDAGDVVVQTLRTGERKVLRTGGADPRYVPTGHLVYALESTLFAVAFDLAALEVRSGPVPVVPQVQRASGAPTGIAQYALSDEGTLVYVGGGADVPLTLALVDRSGNPRVLPGSSSPILGTPRFSPNGRRIVAARGEGDDTNIWIYEVAESLWRQLTFERGDRPVWTPDGRAITFRRDTALWQVPADFSGAAELLPGTEVPTNDGPYDWSPNGEVLLYGSVEGVRALSARNASGKSAADTVVLPPVEGTNRVNRARFSPDGRWVAYGAGTVGESSHVYVSPFPFGAGGNRKVTNDWAGAAVWSPNGRELFVVNPNNSLGALKMSTEPTLTWTNPTTMFSTSAFVPFAVNGTNYDVAPDGNQFVVIVPAGPDTSRARSAQQIQVVLNWFEDLKRLVPTD